MDFSCKFDAPAEQTSFHEPTAGPEIVCGEQFHYNDPDPSSNDEREAEHQQQRDPGPGVVAHSVSAYESEDYTEEETIPARTGSGKQEHHITPLRFSRFGPKSKVALVVQCAFTGFFSSIAAAIYYPVLTVIEQKFNVSEELANVTVVVYFIFQGISPIIMGGFADSLGKRPVILFSVGVYFAACVGLACSKTYGQILGLRYLQAAGIAPVVAVNSGIMGDVTTRAERGGYVGYVSGFQILGSAFGAFIGAGLSSRWGWRAIFWFLAIGSGTCLVISFILLPETKRTLVGNGSVTPKSIFNKSPILATHSARRNLHLNDPEYDSLAFSSKFYFFYSLYVIKLPEIALILLCSGLQFAMYTTHQTALSLVLSTSYKLSVAKIGLCYLPSGICILISIVASGRYLNWSYKRDLNRHLKWIKIEEDKFMEKRKVDIEEARKAMREDYNYTFNIFRSRLQPALVTMLLSSSGFIGFGWCVYAHAPLAALLCMSGFGSLFSNCILTMSTTLVVDLFPSKSSTATGCLNLSRCILSAVFVVSLSKMAQSMTYGGVFTFLGGITSLSSFFSQSIISRGRKFTFRRRKQETLILKNNSEVPVKKIIAV